MGFGMENYQQGYEKLSEILAKFEPKKRNSGAIWNFMELLNSEEIVLFLFIEIDAIKLYASKFLQSTPKHTHLSR